MNYYYYQAYPFVLTLIIEFLIKMVSIAKNRVELELLDRPQIDEKRVTRRGHICREEELCNGLKWDGSRCETYLRNIKGSYNYCLNGKMYVLCPTHKTIFLRVDAYNIEIRKRGSLIE